jgi:hypothetical protein
VSLEERPDEDKRAWLLSRYTERMREEATERYEFLLAALLKVCHGSSDPEIRVAKARLDAAKAVQAFLDGGKL